MKVLLAAINAKYIHSNLAVFSLKKYADSVIGENNENIEINVPDSKLSALPSTGGIGTTIFTIAGCLIMVTAAGLFFASRKRTNK